MLKIITTEIRTALALYSASFNSELSCAESLGVSRGTFRRWLGIDKNNIAEKMELSKWKEIKPKLKKHLPNHYSDLIDVIEKYNTTTDCNIDQSVLQVIGKADVSEKLNIIKHIIYMIEEDLIDNNQ